MSSPAVLLSLPADVVATLAQSIDITQHQGGGVRAPWVPTAAQLQMWRDIADNRFTFFAKGRQVGATTAVTLDDVLWVAVNDAAGHRVRCGIVVDTEDKTRERMLLAGDFVRQLSLDATCNIERIVFRNGSEIVGMTAGGSRVGASTTFQRLHLSELPFWPRATETYGSLMPSLAPDGVCVIETTMDTTEPLGPALWRGENNYKKRFFPVQDHEEYRRELPEGGLPEDRAKWLRVEGWTDERAMSWWLWAETNLCGGDTVRCLREFPQREEHMFQASEARWVRATPVVREPIARVPVVSTTFAETYYLDIYERPIEGHDYVIGVDTATAKDKDRSVVAVVDHESKRLVACFVDGTIYGDDLARVALAARVAYTMPGGKTPRVRIEDNTTGQITIQPAQKIGLGAEAFDTTEDSKYRGLLEAKRAVEAGLLAGPKELVEECDELHRDKNGKWKGHKDILMAYGFCALVISPRVSGMRPDRDDEKRIFAKKMIAREVAKQRARLW